MKEILLLITYLTTGFGCYCVYWRFTDAQYESKFDRFWGVLHIFAWPLTLMAGVLGGLMYYLELLTIKLIRKRFD